MQPPIDHPARTNRLARETSPYLLQHAHNPVDWFAWGAEAFEAARAQDKPIFLSVGYSTCYWCHVMERQSFENERIAAEMNRRFINVKVDREERPDVDQLYMNAVQVLTGQGGWPMSVFLTPDLKPFYGGTYFPPRDGQGRVGFPRLLEALDDAWRNRRAEVTRSADEIVELLKKMAEPPATRALIPIDAHFLERLLERSTADYDPVNGGFGSAPKFPRQTLLELILLAERVSPNPTRLEQALYTLEKLSLGGIHDHLGGAFHRYSTDNQWLVPHFEIMLYDNAMLAWCYAEAFARTGEGRHAAVTRGILDFILREMTSPQGAFYTAIDAEVDAQEGLPYLWTAGEIEEVLGQDAELFNRVYGVAEGPNFADPHHGPAAPDKSILFLAETPDAATEARLGPMRQALYERRRKRKQPLLDTKILTSWNGLMIRAMAQAGKVLNEPKYVAAAKKAADYLLKMHQQADGSLHRTSRDRVAKGSGFLDDYALLALGLLELGEREEAERIAGVMSEKFLDRDKGGFFFTAAGDAEMIVRQKTASDTPLPSGNAAAAMVMLELGRADIARDTIAVFAGQLERFGEGMSALVAAAQRYVHAHGSISVTAGQAAPAERIVTLAGEWEAPDLLHVIVTIAPGFHINAHEAAPGLAATRLSVAGATIEYPPARQGTFEFADGPIPIYDGTIVLAARFARPVIQQSVKLLLQFQACDENSCRAPETIELVVK
jgi:uncharacterized protein